MFLTFNTKVKPHTFALYNKCYIKIITPQSYVLLCQASYQISYFRYVILFYARV